MQTFEPPYFLRYNLCKGMIIFHPKNSGKSKEAQMRSTSEIIPKSSP